MLGISARPDRFLLVAGLLFGLVLAAVTPPFQVPDEPAHFYRAYRVSEGRLDLTPSPGRAGGDLPVSVQTVATTLKGDLPFNIESKIAPRQILAAFQVPLEPDSLWRQAHRGSPGAVLHPLGPCRGLAL